MDKGRIRKQHMSDDRELFEILYRTHLASMQRTVAYYVHDPEDIRDILHDGFLIAFASIDSLKDATKAEAWLTSIMRNLALQYLKKKSHHISVPLSEVSAAAEEADETSPSDTRLTWEELDRIIGRLPEGYGKVFRLAVLDGMSHNEIAALLGIAPRSSSSQLTHAKRMMRHMIAKYRIEMGILSIVAALIFIWQKHDTPHDDTPWEAVITDKPKYITTANDSAGSCPLPRPIAILKSPTPQIQGLIANVNPPADSLLLRPVAARITDSTDSAASSVPDAVLPSSDALTLPHITSGGHAGWSVALAYNGAQPDDDFSRYRMPNQDLPSGAEPDDEIEVTEKTRHHMPVVIGLSFNKALTPRWNIGTGLRYTFLRSDILTESRLTRSETFRRIHYIGIPLKCSYMMFAHNGFSLYGHAGAAIDIPVKSRQYVHETPSDGSSPGITTVHIRPPLQWSVECGIGIQYHFTPSFGIYAEPTFRYYPSTGTDIRTIRSDRPYEFAIPVGLRLTW